MVQEHNHAARQTTLVQGLGGHRHIGVQFALTPHHAKYFAWELTRRRAANDEDRLSSRYSTRVSTPTHIIDAATFALQSGCDSTPSAMAIVSRIAVDIRNQVGNGT